jgi:hypothetical protein
MEMERRPGGDRVGKKVLALFLLYLFAVVVLSASPEWVAWEGPLVIGSLDVQTTDSGFPSRDKKSEGDGLLDLLVIVSAGAILLLTSRRLGLGDVPPRKTAVYGNPPHPTGSMFKPSVSETGDIPLAEENPPGQSDLL